MAASLPSFLRFVGERFDLGGDDRPEAAIHHRLAAWSVASATTGFALFPVWVVAGGPGGLLGAAVFLWLFAPLGAALYGTKTGRPAVAANAALAMALALAITLAAMTGSFASPFLAGLPAILIASRWLRPSAPAAPVLVMIGIGLVLLAAAALLDLPIPTILLPPWLSGGLVLAAGAAVLAFRRAHRGTDAAPVVASTLETLDEAPDLLTRHDQTGAVKYASAAAMRIAGVAASDLEGGGLFRLIQIADRPLYLMALSEALREGKETAVEYRLRRTPAGKPEVFALVETRWRKTETPEGDPALVGLTRDISHRKAVEPGAADVEPFLSNQPANDTTARHRVTRVHPEAENRTPIALAPLIRRCLDELRDDAARRGIKAEHRIAADLDPVLCEVAGMERVLRTLVSNAIRLGRQDGKVLVAAARDADGVNITVESRGVPTAAQDLPRSGSPFFRIDSAYNRVSETVGLGLAVVEGIVAAHHGRVAMESLPHEGTAVSVWLPSGTKPRNVGNAWERAYSERKSA